MKNKIVAYTTIIVLMCMMLLGFFGPTQEAAALKVYREFSIMNQSDADTLFPLWDPSSKASYEYIPPFCRIELKTDTSRNSDPWSPEVMFRTTSIITDMSYNNPLIPDMRNNNAFVSDNISGTSQTSLDDDDYEPNDTKQTAYELDQSMSESNSNLVNENSWYENISERSVEVSALKLSGRNPDYFQFHHSPNLQALIEICFKTSRSIKITLYEYSSNTIFKKLGEYTIADGECLPEVGICSSKTYVLGIELAETASLTTFPVQYSFKITIWNADEDPDNDGVSYPGDNCPEAFNPDQQDYNGDGIGDTCDDDLTPCTKKYDISELNNCDPSRDDCDESSYICSGRITIKHDRKLRYWRNYPLGTYNEAVTRAFVVLHGYGRTAYNTFRRAVEVARWDGVENNTIIIAPHFITIDEDPESDELSWTANGWSAGWNALFYPHTSSFTVMDVIFDKLDSSNFPNLEEIVLYGHSAGGQFVQRFAAGSEMDHSMSVPVRYMVANPSSYMYLDEIRPVTGSVTQFAIPNQFSRPCLEYNCYRYGPVARNEYMNRVTTSEICNQYPARKVYYLLGEDDTYCPTILEDPGDSCDNTCMAYWQGENRYRRGEAFSNYMDYKYSTNNHQFIKLPGVDHNGTHVLRSCEARQVFFEIDSPAECGTEYDIGDTCSYPDLEVKIDPSSFDAKPFCDGYYLVTLAAEVENTNPFVSMYQDSFDVRWNGPIASDFCSTDCDPGVTDCSELHPVCQYFPGTRTVRTGINNVGMPVRLENQWLVDEALFPNPRFVIRGYYEREEFSITVNPEDQYEELNSLNNSDEYLLIVGDLILDPVEPLDTEINTIHVCSSLRIALDSQQIDYTNWFENDKLFLDDIPIQIDLPRQDWLTVGSTLAELEQGVVVTLVRTSDGVAFMNFVPLEQEVHL